MARNEGFKYWSDQEFVQGFDTNAYLMSQSVMRFDNSADRDSALARTLTSGMVAYDKSTTTLQLYDGTGWQTIGVIGVVDHGTLVGLGDDDHTQYHNDTRGDARYYTQTQIDTLLAGLSTDHGDLTGLSDDDHSQYHNDARGDARYLQLSGGTVTGQTTFSATDGVKITGSSGGVWWDDRNGDGSKWVMYHSGDMIGLWNGTSTPFEFKENGTGYATNWSVGTGSSANAFMGGSNYWRPQDAYGNSYFDINSGSFYVDAGTYYFRNASSVNSLTIDSSGNGTFAGDLYSGNKHYLRGTDPTTYYQDSNNRSAMIHVNSNIFYVLRGSGTNSTTWAQYNSHWPLELNLENNNATFGGDIYMRAVNANRPSIYRVGGIYFTWDSDSYGTNSHHSIRSTDGDTWSDDITINSYGNVRINIDSNSNGSNEFSIGHHTTGTGNKILYIPDNYNGIYLTGWYRTFGQRGWYSQTYGGGIYMTDTTWVRTYNNKAFYTSSTLRGDGQIQTTRNSTGNISGASINLGIGNGSGVIMTMNPANYGPLITVGQGEIFYIRNYLNSTYAYVYGYLNNVSSKHYKTNIRTLGEATPSVGSAGTTFDAMEKVRQLRPVTYHHYERDALPRMPINEDGTKNERRIDAINRLDKIRKKNGLGHFERDDLKHICGRDCEGDIQNPCFRYKNWTKGKIGFIAQEVGQVLNEIADFSEERPDEHESIDSLGLIAVCVKALQEIDHRLTNIGA